MICSVELALQGGVIALPRAIKKHLKLCSGAAIKVLCCLSDCDGPSCDTALLAAQCGITEAECHDALLYWQRAGLVRGDLSCTAAPVHTTPSAPAPREAGAGREPPLDPVGPGADPVPRAQAGAAAAQAFDTGAANVKVLSTRPPRPDRRQVAERLLKSAELRFLADAVAKLLGHPLQHTDLSALIAVHDWCGMPCEVILTAVSYCVSVGSPSMRAVEKEAQRWADRGVKTLEDAEAMVGALYAERGAVAKLAEILGVAEGDIAPRDRSFAAAWLLAQNDPPELILEAKERTLQHKGKLHFPYIDSLLCRWRIAGYRTRAAVQRADPKREKKKSRAEGFGSSLSMEQLEQHGLRSTPVFGKKG